MPLIYLQVPSVDGSRERHAYRVGADSWLVGLLISFSTIDRRPRQAGAAGERLRGVAGRPRLGRRPLPPFYPSLHSSPASRVVGHLGNKHTGHRIDRRVG